MRGVIRNRERAVQCRDFSGLAYGKITPTDIDAFIDFHNEVFVFIEAKVVGFDLPRGQRIALERLYHACQAGGVKTFIAISEHNTAPEDDIDYGSMLVCEYMCGTLTEWQKPRQPTTLKQFVDYAVGQK